MARYPACTSTRARSSISVTRSFLRNQLVRMLEEAEAERDPEIRKRLLTFVVAGGGFSGIRCIAEMNEFFTRGSKRLPQHRRARSPIDTTPAERSHLARSNSIARELRASFR